MAEVVRDHVHCNGHFGQTAEVWVIKDTTGFQIDFAATDFNGTFLDNGANFVTHARTFDGPRYITENVFSTELGKELLEIFTHFWIDFYHELLCTPLLTPTSCQQTLEKFLAVCPHLRVVALRSLWPQETFDTALAPRVYELFVGACLGEARKRILEENCTASSDDVEYKTRLLNLLAVEHALASFVQSDTGYVFDKGLFLRIWDTSWGYSREQSSSYCSEVYSSVQFGRALIEEHINRFSYFTGGRLSGSFVRSFIALPGAGKTSTQTRIAFGYERYGLVRESATAIQSLSAQRDQDYQQIVELKARLATIQDDQLSYHLRQMLASYSILYMEPRINESRRFLLGFLDFLSKSEPDIQQNMVFLCDTLGISPFATIAAVRAINDLVKEDSTLINSLRTDSRFILPTGLSSKIQNMIQHFPFYKEVIGATVFPWTVALDWPIAEIEERTVLQDQQGDPKAALRLRHLDDYASLRLIYLTLQQMFPEAIVLVRCNIGGKKLSPFQVACEAERACVFAGIHAACIHEIYPTGYIIDEIINLMQRVERMAEFGK